MYLFLLVCFMGSNQVLAHPYTQNYLANELRLARMNMQIANEDKKLKEKSGALESSYDHLIKATQLFTCYPAVQYGYLVFMSNPLELPIIGYDPTGTVGVRINGIKPKNNPKLDKYSYFIISLEYQGLHSYETQTPLGISLQVFDGQVLNRLDVYNNSTYQSDFDKLAKRHKLPSRFDPKSMSAIHAAFLPGSLNVFGISSFTVNIDGTKIFAPNLILKGNGI